MRQLKSLPLSLFFKSCFTFSIRPKPTLQGLKPLAVSNPHSEQNHIDEQPVTPSTQPNLPYPEYMKQSINKFPYCRLPRFSQKMIFKKGLSEEELERWVAFTALFYTDYKAKQQELRQMGIFLLKDEFAKQDKQQFTGPQIFHRHYGKKLPDIVKEINSGLVSQQQIVFRMQILVNLMPNQQVKKQVQNIKEDQIMNMPVQIQSLYLKLLSIYGLSSISVIDSIYKSLLSNKSSFQHGINPQFECAKFLINIEKFQKYLPSQLASLAMTIITKNIKHMDAIEKYQILKRVYYNKGSECLQFAQKLTQEISQIFEQMKGDQLNVPIVIKLLKYRNKHNLSNEVLAKIINTYPSKFNTVFRQQNLNKEVFLTAMSKQSSTLNYQIKNQLEAFIQKTFNEYSRIDQIDEISLIRNIKLFLKYAKDLTKQALSQTQDILVSNIYQRAKTIASDELKYFILLATISFPSSKNLSPDTKQLHADVVENFHHKCLQNADPFYINSMINIQFQFNRRQMDPKLRKNIFLYNYQKFSPQLPAYSCLFYLMKEGNSNGSTDEKKIVLSQLYKDILSKLSSNGFSLKVIFTLIDILDQTSFDKKQLYSKIESSIRFHLQKGLMQGGKKQNGKFLMPKDVSFLIRKLVTQNKCSKKFSQFLTSSTKNFNFIDQYLKQYLQSSQNWQKMMLNRLQNNRQKNRLNSERGSDEKKEQNHFQRRTNFAQKQERYQPKSYNYSQRTQSSTQPSENYNRERQNTKQRAKSSQIRTAQGNQKRNQNTSTFEKKKPKSNFKNQKF